MTDLSSNILALASTLTLPTQILFLSLFSFLEGLPVVGSILPGGTIALLAGSIATEGFLSPLVAALVVGTSSFLGDMTGFFLAKKFRHTPWIIRITSHEKHQKSWDLFDRHLALVSIFGKLLPVIRSTPSLFAGIRGVRTKRYVIYSFIGSYLWGFIGVYSGNAIRSFFGPKAITVIFGILVISIFIMIFRMVLEKYNKKK